MLHLGVLMALLLLLPGPAAALAWPGDGAEEAPARPGREIEGGRGGCCGRGGSAGEGPRCAMGGGRGCCGGMGRHGVGPRHGRAGGGPGRGGPPAVMETVRALVHDYRHEIERRVDEVENGVVTVTRAPSSEAAAAAIRRHVGEMKQLLEEGGRVRMWDPLFRELFAHADEIVMELEELEDGMKVTETSDDPEVVALIRAHARKVTEFIERGPAAVHEETPLPAAYEAVR